MINVNAEQKHLQIERIPNGMPATLTFEQLFGARQWSHRISGHFDLVFNLSFDSSEHVQAPNNTAQSQWNAIVFVQQSESL